MKLIIDISEEYYCACKSWDKDNVAMIEQSIIAHGTPYDEERPHGEWVAINNTHMGSEIHVCSECKKKRILIDTPFCPWCGADMQTQNDRSFDTSGRGVSGSVENSISQKEGGVE